MLAVQSLVKNATQNSLLSFFNQSLLMPKSRRFDDEQDDRKSRRRSDDDDDRQSRRRRNDNDDEEYEDTRSRRRERGRKDGKPFPLVLVLVLIFVPILLVGGYFGIRAMRSGSSSTQPSADDLKTVRAKIAGHWKYEQGGGERMELTFLGNESVTLEVATRNASRSITTNYELIDWGNDRISIRIHFDVHTNTVFELRIEVVSEQQLRVSITNSSNSEPRIFTKQCAESEEGEIVLKRIGSTLFLFLPGTVKKQANILLGYRCN